MGCSDCLPRPRWLVKYAARRRPGAAAGRRGRAALAAGSRAPRSGGRSVVARPSAGRPVAAAVWGRSRPASAAAASPWASRPADVELPPRARGPGGRRAGRSRPSPGCSVARSAAVPVVRVGGRAGRARHVEAAAADPRGGLEAVSASCSAGASAVRPAAPVDRSGLPASPRPAPPSSPAGHAEQQRAGAPSSPGYAGSQPQRAHQRQHDVRTQPARQSTERPRRRDEGLRRPAGESARPAEARARLRRRAPLGGPDARSSAQRRR